MEELTTRRLDLRRQMLENTREAETIQRQRKRGRDYAAKFTEGRPHKKHRRCLLLFLAVAGGHADIAVSMLQRVPKFKFPWQDWSDERRRVFVEDVGLQSPWEDLLEAVDVQDSTNAKLCHTARRLFAEARTATWARALNRERGMGKPALPGIRRSSGWIWVVSTPCTAGPGDFASGGMVASAE